MTCTFLECIGVSITSVRCLDLYRITLCMCSTLLVAVSEVNMSRQTSISHSNTLMETKVPNFVKLKTYNCIVFTDFQHTKLYPFQNLSLGFILKIFLKFHKFQPRYSYKIYSYKKKECSPLDSGSKGPCSSPGQVIVLCSWARHFTLHPGVEMVTGQLSG